MIIHWLCLSTLRTTGSRQGDALMKSDRFQGSLDETEVHQQGVPCFVKYCVYFSVMLIVWIQLDRVNMVGACSRVNVDYKTSSSAKE